MIKRHIGVMHGRRQLSPHKSEAGMAQGNVLGPLLWNVYINSLLLWNVYINNMLNLFPWARASEGDVTVSLPHTGARKPR